MELPPIIRYDFITGPNTGLVSTLLPYILFILK